MNIIEVIIIVEYNVLLSLKPTFNTCVMLLSLCLMKFWLSNAAGLDQLEVEKNELAFAGMAGLSISLALSVTQVGRIAVERGGGG